MTIYINKNTSNILNFTLDERVIIGMNANRFMQLTYKEDSSIKLMWLFNDLSFSSRVNKYLIEEVPLIEEDLEGGKVNLKLGSYDYFIWETNEATLSLDVDKNLLESGIIRVEN